MSSNDQEANVIECRICHSKTTRDLILSPCMCKGSMGCVHIGCLEQWLNISSHTFCELCSYKFEVIQVRRYTFCQSIPVWLVSNRNNVYRTLFFLTLCTINTSLLCWMWFLWITSIPSSFVKEKKTERNDAETTEQETDQVMSQSKWIIVFIFLTVLTVFSFKGLCFDACLVLKEQYQSWYRWWNSTVNVQLVLDLQNYKISNKMDDANTYDFKYTQEKFSAKREDENYYNSQIIHEEVSKKLGEVPSTDDFRSVEEKDSSFKLGNVNNLDASKHLGEASNYDIKRVEEKISSISLDNVNPHDVKEIVNETLGKICDNVCDEDIIVAYEHSTILPEIEICQSNTNGNQRNNKH
ncbi:uncharacterized protein LOC124360172 isoform X1 [Homalodisca vitripennis]|uniref:uncharacterized protein LOC124360172 isoform X1 n=1 Tax=Homalodisca vitripennis TaxID=197043 RepID=UPI001EEC1048|nr:uncharacterized protein LOC124360172 isoform X1 [Homalodisca vitripennis]